MKKFGLLFLSTLAAFSVSAQTVEESKTFDNFYIGVNGGVATPTKGHAWLGDLNPNAGIRLGRWFTPVFGVAVEGNAYFSNKPAPSFGTVVRHMNADALATVNFNNWLFGYKGQARPFEVIGLAGLGWGHSFNNKGVSGKDNFISKLALDFALNFGADKEYQFYIEPSINHALNGGGYDGMQMNVNKSACQLNAGFIYRFMNTNGTHNFKIAQLRDQAEVDNLNAEINRLRSALAQKPKEVVKEVVKEIPVNTDNLLFVTFAQGKSILTDEAKAVLDKVTEGKHVQVFGTASPEGTDKINAVLSQARADVVAEYLSGRGVVIDEAVGKGSEGITSNRLAIIYVK